MQITTTTKYSARSGAAAIAYVGAIVLANYTISIFGPVVSPINAFLLIGLDLSLRDSLHEKLGIGFVSLLTIIAGVVSYVLNPAAGMIAIASAVSFMLANLFDGATYHKLIKKPFMVKSNSSNAVGAGVDSIAFPTIAFGSLMPEIILMQFIAKLSGGFVWSLIINKVK